MLGDNILYADDGAERPAPARPRPQPRRRSPTGEEEGEEWAEPEIFLDPTQLGSMTLETDEVKPMSVTFLHRRCVRKGRSTPSGEPAPSASLSHRKARAAPTHPPEAPPGQLGSLDRPQQLASGRPQEPIFLPCSSPGTASSRR